MADSGKEEGASGAGRAGESRLGVTASARRAVVVIAMAVAADGLLRCLRRTARLTRTTSALAVIAGTDPLTALPNRRHIEEHLAGAVSAARRHRHPLSVLFLDIDNFKHVNDELGYEAGDEVLRVVGGRMRSAVRTEDLVGRWGGEEFVAVLPATDLDGAVALAERIRTVIEAAAVTSADGLIPVTVSIGCASGRPEPMDLIRGASRALRHAKQDGKNRVVAAPPMPQ
jgi:two-component system, cell cycle response regulator